MNFHISILAIRQVVASLQLTQKCCTKCSTVTYTVNEEQNKKSQKEFCALFVHQFDAAMQFRIISSPNDDIFTI